MDVKSYEFGVEESLSFYFFNDEARRLHREAGRSTLVIPKILEGNKMSFGFGVFVV